MTSAYISYLPKYNSYRPKTSTASSVAYFHTDNNAHNCFLQMRVAFKTAVENKRKALNILIKTAALAFLVVFSEAAIPVLSGKSKALLTILLYPHRPYYQTFRTLRI
jgi:hypothetical protein